MSNIKKDFKNHMHNTLRIKNDEIEQIKNKLIKEKSLKIISEKEEKEESQFDKIKETEKVIASKIKNDKFQKTRGIVSYSGQKEDFEEKMTEVIKEELLKKIEKTIKIKIKDK